MPIKFRCSDSGYSVMPEMYCSVVVPGLVIHASWWVCGRLSSVFVCGGPLGRSRRGAGGRGGMYADAAAYRIIMHTSDSLASENLNVRCLTILYIKTLSLN